MNDCQLGSPSQTACALRQEDGASVAVERALSRDIVGLVRGAGGARWLQMLLVELPRLLGRGQTGFVKHLVEEVPWFDKSQVGRREFALFEEFCVALASLESDFLSPLIKHFFLRLRDTARAPPPALLSLRCFNLGAPFASLDAVLDQVQKILKKHTPAADTTSPTPTPTPIQDEEAVHFLRSLLQHHPNPAKQALVASDLTRIQVGRSQGTLCFFLQPVVGPAQQISFIKALHALSDAAHKSLPISIRRQYNVYGARCAHLLSKLAKELPGAKLLLMTTLSQLFPKRRCPLRMQLICAKVVFSIARQVEELEDEILALFFQQLIFLDSECATPPRYDAPSPGHWKDSERALDAMLQCLLHYIDSRLRAPFRMARKLSVSSLESDIDQDQTAPLLLTITKTLCEERLLKMPSPRYLHFFLAYFARPSVFEDRPVYVQRFVSLLFHKCIFQAQHGPGLLTSFLVRYADLETLEKSVLILLDQQLDPSTPAWEVLAVLFCLRSGDLSTEIRSECAGLLLKHQSWLERLPKWLFGPLKQQLGTEGVVVEWKPREREEAVLELGALPFLSDCSLPLSSRWLVDPEESEASSIMIETNLVAPPSLPPEEELKELPLQQELRFERPLPSPSPCEESLSTQMSDQVPKRRKKRKGSDRRCGKLVAK